VKKIACASLSLFAVLWFCGGCQTSPRSSAYAPPYEEGVATRGFDIHDYDLTVEKMVGSMLSKVQPAGGKQPVVTFGPVVNRTNYRIETHMLLEDIRVEALKSGNVLFSAATDYRKKGGEAGQIYKQLEFQNESGHVEPATVKQYGQIVGADYILFGNIYNVERRQGGTTEANYRAILTMHEVATGLVVWSDKMPIRKYVR